MYIKYTFSETAMNEELANVNFINSATPSQNYPGIYSVKVPTNQNLFIKQDAYEVLESLPNFMKIKDGLLNLNTLDCIREMGLEVRFTTYYGVNGYGSLLITFDTEEEKNECINNIVNLKNNFSSLKELQLVSADGEVVTYKK